MNSLNCRWLDDYVAGELPVDWEPLFEQHLENCDACRQEVQAWQTMRDLLGQATGELEQPPKSLTQRIQQSLTPVQPQQLEQPRTRLLSAVVAVCLLAGLFLLVTPERQDQPAQPTHEPLATTQEHKPLAYVSLPDDVIGVPVDIGDPDVTVVWLYPVYQPDDETQP